MYNMTMIVSVFTLSHLPHAAHSYSDSMEMYMEEEETRYLLPLKEYIAYCDSLRYVL